jgi:crotonobetainyl-CoA:carnitine CoA-transferase CaiB-like acyl-CoA transferase
MHGLRDLRVVDLSSGIAGAYTSKLFADAGADVIKVEGPDGDPLRRWTVSGTDLGDRDGAFFRFLHCSKRAVVGSPEDPEIQALIEGADLVIDSFPPGQHEEALDVERFPGLVRLSITPYGRGGPFEQRPVSEFTVQSECGSTARRGLPDMEPFHAAGRITEYIAAVFAAVGGAAAVRRSQQTGHGEHVDVSWLEGMAIAANTYSDLMWALQGSPEIVAPPRVCELPSIEPTLDGWVGFNTNSRQQFNDFLVLIERPDMLDDEELPTVLGRKRRVDEWNAMVREYTRAHPTEEIVEKASLLRIPVAPVNSGRTVLDHPHLRARGVFIPHPDGDFEMPRPSYMVDDQTLGPRSPAPRLGQHTGQVEARARAPRPTPSGAPALPLAGLRILDCTAWWAGPSSTCILAALGADVIHVESIQKPDGMRMTGAMVAGMDQPWWEYSAVYLAANTNKRSLTLDFSHPDGLDAMKRLIQTSDAVVENFSPRVFGNFGLEWPQFHELSPSTILVRMPAFGLSGPWRDNVGFAQTMEQVSGLAWITGHPWDQPRIQQGPCDPLAGMHAAFALHVGLAERAATGQGSLLEVTMVEGALNAAAEQIVEWSAYGYEMQREGNRSPYAAPQGLYPCTGWENWLSLSCESDEQWQGLRKALGEPEWAADPAFDTHAGRRARHDELDEHLRAWAADRDIDAAVEHLISHGVPAAPARDPRRNASQPQLVARRFEEPVEHPIVGTHPLPRPPFTYSHVDRWIRTRAPLMGEHSREILSELGYTDADLDRFEAEQIIGYKPAGY